MKKQREPSGSQFCPNLRMPSSRKKPRTRFVSPRMNRIFKQFKKSQAYMLSNNANRRDSEVANEACMNRSKTYGSSRTVNANDRQHNAVAFQMPKIRQQRSIVRPSTLSAIENLIPLAKSASKSKHALAPLSKDLKQPTTSSLGNRVTSLSDNINQINPSRLGDGSSSRKMETPGPLRLKNDSNATLGCSTKSHLKMEKEGSIRTDNAKRSNSRSNNSKAMAVLFHNSKDVDESNRCNNVLGSRLKGQSNPDQGDALRGGDNNKRLKSLKDKEVVTTPKGSNLSMAKELLVPNKDCLNEDKKDQDEVMTIQGHTSVTSIGRTLSGDVYFMCDDDDHMQEQLLKATKASNSCSTLKGNEVMQDLQSNLGNNSRPIFGKDLSSHQMAKASCMGNNIEQNGHSPDGCVQLDSRDDNPRFAEDGRTDNVKFKRKRPEPLPKDKLETHDDNDTEEAKNYRSMEKWRKNIKNEDEEADGGDQNTAGVGDGTAGLTIQTAALKHHPTKVYLPFVSESVRQHCSSQPIDEPIWSGIFKIGNKEYVSLAAHLSTKSCQEVWSLSKSLPPMVEITKHCRLEAWPKSFETSRPTDDSIGLYFFPHKMRPDEDLDQLVEEVMKNDMVLQTVIGEAEVLILPSILLPEPYQTFQRKHYLWGLFKRRTDKVAVVEEHHGAQEEEMENQRPSHQPDKAECEESDQEPLTKLAMRLRNERLVDTHRGVDRRDEEECEESDQEPLMKRAKRLQNQRLVGTHRGVDQRDEEECEESDQEPLMKRAMRLQNQRLEGTHRGVEKEGVEASAQQVEASCVLEANMGIEFQAVAKEAERQGTDLEPTPPSAGSNTPRLAGRAAEANSAPVMAAAMSTNHGRIQASLEVSPGKVFCFVVRQTPRLEQLIQELERESALVVAIQGEMIGSGLGQAAAME